MLKHLNRFSLLSIVVFTINSYAQDNYHCDYHTQSSCTSTTYGNSQYLTQSSLLTTDTNYVLSSITTNSTTTETSSSTEGGGSSTAKASIAIAYVNTNDTSITVLPLSYDVTNKLSYTASVSYVDDSLTGQKGMGDSSIGVSYKFTTDTASNGADLEYTTKRDSNYIKVLSALSLPTGDASKGLSLEMYSLTLGIEFSRNIEPLNSTVFLSYNYNRIIDLPEFNLLDTVRYNKKNTIYGNKRITILGYDQMLTNLTQLNLKYLYLDAESTKIDSTDQNDYTIYTDFSIGFSLSLNIAAVSVGMLVPIDEVYGPGISNPKDREIIYYMSLSKAF